MPNFDPDYDYTGAQNAPAVATAYVMPDVESANDAGTIEEEAAKYDFQPVPPGTYKFLVKKLIKPIEIVSPSDVNSVSSAMFIRPQTCCWKSSARSVQSDCHLQRQKGAPGGL